MSLDQDLDLFFGRSSDAATQVYARVALRQPQNAKLIGTISGPFCLDTRTLPTSVTFRDLGPGKTLLARAVVPDFCPWSSEQPHLYRVRVELLVDGTVIDVAQREWGAHRFAVRNGDFLWNATRVVLRGIHRRFANQALDQWQIEGSPVMVVDDPDERLCHEASRRGVPLVATTAHGGHEGVERLKWLARWSAVLIVLVDGQLPQDFQPRESIPNLVLGVDAGKSHDIPPWAHVIVCSDSMIGEIADHNVNALPVIATRTIDDVSDIAAARAECDVLQRDLAGIGQFAGYFIL